MNKIIAKRTKAKVFYELSSADPPCQKGQATVVGDGQKIPKKQGFLKNITNKKLKTKN